MFFFEALIVAFNAYFQGRVVKLGQVQYKTKINP